MDHQVFRRVPPRFGSCGFGLLVAVCCAIGSAETNLPPVTVSPPNVLVHSVGDPTGRSFVLTWDYLFDFSSKFVTGFTIHRRKEGEEYERIAEVGKSGEERNTTVYRESAKKYVYSYADRNIQPGVEYAYRVAAVDASGKQAFHEVRIETDPKADSIASPENVLVVVNRRSRESKEIGEYYRSKRGIPKRNVLGIACDPSLKIVSLASFERAIKHPIREYLDSNQLKEKILYIVMTYGVPYMIMTNEGKTADSLDAYLFDLFDEYSGDSNLRMSPSSARYRNPYYLAGSHFSRANGNRGYLVTRLDGPLAEKDDRHFNRDTAHRDDPLQYLKNMVDYALWAEQNSSKLSGKGYFDRRFKDPGRNRYGRGDRYIHGGYDCSREMGFRSVLDTNPQLFGSPPTNSGGADPLVCDAALWYAGWYSHFYKDAFEWQRGAVGFHIESWTALDIRKKSRYQGQEGWLWVPGMIQAGVTATMGAVFEPGLGGLPGIDWFFRYFFHGFCLAESAYMANYSAAGQVVVIGDPLYNPFRNNPLDRMPPNLTITSPKAGETVRGTRLRIEGTLDDPSISMLDNAMPVTNGHFSYDTRIGSPESSETSLPVVVGATDTSGNRTGAAVTVNWVNQAPSLRAPAPMEVDEGETLTAALEACDPDDDPLSYSFAAGSDQPKGALLDQGTGKFTWTPGPKQAGQYTFAFRVTDGFASKVQRATVTVKQAGSHPPKFLSASKQITGKVGRMVYIALKAEDPDEDRLVFSPLGPLPAQARIVQPFGGYAVFLWEPDARQIGRHEVTFKVSDGKGGEDTMTVEIDVGPAPPATKR